MIKQDQWLVTHIFQPFVDFLYKHSGKDGIFFAMTFSFAQLCLNLIFYVENPTDVNESATIVSIAILVVTAIFCSRMENTDKEDRANSIRKFGIGTLIRITAAYLLIPNCIYAVTIVIRNNNLEVVPIAVSIFSLTTTLYLASLEPSEKIKGR